MREKNHCYYTKFIYIIKFKDKQRVTEDMRQITSLWNNLWCREI